MRGLALALFGSMRKKQEVKQGIYHGDVGERPRGLTTEQANDQRSGAKIDERQTREAAQGERGDASSVMPRGDRQPRPGARDGKDELTEEPYGKK